MLPFTGRNRLTSPFGTRVLNGQTVNHKGIDLVGDDNRDVHAVQGGVVQQSAMVTDKSNLTWQWGNYVCIKTAEGMLHYYCHMDSRAVKAGDTVREGDKIGVMGNTGYSFGAHLHFEVRDAAKNSKDPTPLLGIPNKTGSYTGGTASAAAKPASGKLTVFGVAKGINVQAFTGCSVNQVAQAGGQDIRVADGEYKVLSLHGSAEGFDWCQIDYNGKSLYMPYNGAVQDRCSIQLD